ncbi:hypothetical protein AAA294_07235 [Fusobacterium varium]|uniref:hypothetical protein n=1 Tax=Fusobacterium varium TaxID=856 RepID=UPI0032C0813E
MRNIKEIEQKIQELEIKMNEKYEELKRVKETAKKAKIKSLNNEIFFYQSRIKTLKWVLEILCEI